MSTLIWLILFGFLMFIPGSTLNAIKSIAATVTKTEASKPTPPTAPATVTTTPSNSFPTLRGKSLRVNTTSRVISTTAVLAPLNSHKTTTVLWTPSIGRSAWGEVQIDAQITAKPSITASKKDGGDVAKSTEVATAIDEYKFAAEFSTSQITPTTARTPQTEFAEAKVTTAAAGEAIGGSPAQSTTKVYVTTKRTKASLSRTVTADKEGGRSVLGERGENDGSRIDSMVAKSTAAATPTAMATSEGHLASLAIRATTMESLSAAAAAQLVATLFPITTISDDNVPKNSQNTAVSAYAYSQQSTDNSGSHSNYNYDYKKEGEGNINSGVAGGIKNMPSAYLQRRQPQQQNTPPLQRPKIHTAGDGNNSNSKSNSYFYNSNNNYFNSQLSAAGSVMVMQQQQQQEPQPLRQLRQQYARQLHQQPYYSTTIATPPTPVTTSTPVTVMPAIDKNLIGNVIPSERNSANFNKSVPMESRKNHKQTALASAPSAVSVTLITVATKAESEATGVAGVAGVAAVALAEREAINITTPASPFPTVATTTMKSTTRRPPPTTTPRPTPSIDDYQTVISQAGTHAYLPCNVKQLVKKPISWLRVRDEHILTVDQTTFIADQRFQSIFAPNPERWSLQIKYVQLKDEGIYECQVSTEPKSSAIVTLRVVEPRTELIGEPSRHVKAGSQVKLRCIISQALEPPLFINWFHNQKQIYLHSRRGWRTEIERIELPITDAPTTTSTTTTTTDTPRTASTTDDTSPTTTVQVESATTITASATAAAASATAIAITTILSEANDFDNYSDMVNAGTQASAVQATGTDTALPTTMGSASIPPSAATVPTTRTTTTNGESSKIGVGNSFAFGTGNTTSSLVAAMAAAAVTVSTALPTITKTMNWPKTTTPIATASTTLAAVEVRQITTASLIISSVEKQDSGNYTCSPSNSAPKTVVLHVLNGEYSASAITSGVSGYVIFGKHWEWLGVLLLLLLHRWHNNPATIPTLLRIVASVVLLFLWPRAERITNGDIAKTTVTAAISNATAPARKVYPLSRGHVQRRAFQHKQLAGDWDQGNQHNLRGHPIGIDAGIATRADNARNCDDIIWHIDWRTGSMLLVLPTKEKT